MASGTGISAGNRALKARLRDRKLPSLETRATDPITQASLETLAEHLRVYEGDVRAPKERFITLKELEDAGLIKTGTKSGYAYIAQVLQRDVAQKAGSTANPSLKGVIKKDTSRQARTPGGGGGGGSATNPIEVGKSGQGAKLNDNADVLVPSPAQREFLYYDGSKWTAYPLFKRENKWFSKQYFVGGSSFTGPAVEDYIDFTEIAAPTYSAGRLWYDSAEGLLGFYNSVANATIHLGQDSVVYVRNASGGVISKGEAVYSDSATGNRPNIQKAQADTLATSRVLGLVMEDIADNADGWVMQAGHIGSLDTSAFTAGDELFLSATVAGGLTATKPSGTNFAVVVGECTVSNPANGDIAVHLRPTADSAQKSIAQTLTGAWTFSAKSYFLDTVEINNAVPKLLWIEDDAAADNGWWDMVAEAEQFRFRIRGDADSGGADIFTVDRTGTALTNMTFNPISIFASSVYVYNQEMIRFYDATESAYGGFSYNDTDTYGSLKVTGNTKSGYLGIALDVPGGDTHTIMASTSNVGWYNDTNDQWLLRWADGGNTYLYRDGNTTSHLELTNYLSTGASSGVQIRKHDGSLYYAGIGTMPRVVTNSNVTLAAQHNEGLLYSNDASTYTITVGSTTDFPVEGVFTILNYGSGNINVNVSGSTLLWPNGSANSGNRVVGPYSVATLWHFSSSVWFIWGSSIT